MKFLNRISLRHDLGIQLMVLYIIFVGLVVTMTLLFARATRMRLEADIKAADLALARSIAQETDLEMRNALQAVREIGMDEGVLRSNLNIMEDLFSTMLKVRPNIDYIHRLNNQGFLTYHYPPGSESFIGSDLSDQDYFQRAQLTTQGLISKGSISPITKQPVASAVMPLWDENANFKGVLATNIKLESLSLTLDKIANEYPPEEEFRVVIVDSAGQIIAHPDSELLLTQLPEEQKEIVQAVLLGKASNIVGRDEYGRNILFSFVPISRSGWGVVVSRPTEKAFATSTAFYRGVLLILAIFVLVGFVFWIGLNHQAIRPLSHLVNYSQTIGQEKALINGARQQLTGLSKRTDQVGHLTNSLLRMEKEIEGRLNELSILLQTSAYVLGSLDSRTVLQRILNQVEQLLKVGMSAIVAVDVQHSEYRVQASHGISEIYIQSIEKNPNDSQSVITRAILSSSPVQVSDTETDPGLTNSREKAKAEGYQSILAIPLKTQHTPPSALIIFRPDPHVFTEQEITLLSNFANHAAMAIENAALYARSDTRLQAQSRRLEALIQSLNDGLILGNLEGKILYANRSACDWVNQSHDEVVGSSIEEYIEQLLSLSPDPEQSKDLIKTAIDDSSEKLAEITLNIHNETKHLRLRRFNVMDSSNAPIGYGQILQDFTADFELDRLKSSLISTVSHELRTPLASIKGYTTTLLADDVDWDWESQREFLQIISDETDRLSDFVTDLLDLSRLETGDSFVSRSECDFREVVSRAAERAQPPPGTRLQLEIPSDLPYLNLDIRRIEVVMRNLIENATKYSGIHSPIWVSVFLDNGNLIVKVRDEGPGIPEGEGDRIFERFYRAAEDVPHIPPGFGLGLSICQGFIKAHGGEIWTEDCETGACIGFAVPIDGSNSGK